MARITQLDNVVATLTANKTDLGRIRGEQSQITEASTHHNSRVSNEHKREWEGVRGHMTVLTPMTGSGRTQVVHDALETGKKGRDGLQSWDHALSGTSAHFANDKAPGVRRSRVNLREWAFPAGTMQLPQTSEWKRRLGKEGACPDDGSVTTVAGRGQGGSTFRTDCCVVYLCLSFSSDDHHLSRSCLGTGMRFGT